MDDDLFEIQLLGDEYQGLIRASSNEIATSPPNFDTVPSAQFFERWSVIPHMTSFRASPYYGVLRSYNAAIDTFTQAQWSTANHFLQWEVPMDLEFDENEPIELVAVMQNRSWVEFGDPTWGGPGALSVNPNARVIFEWLPPNYDFDDESLYPSFTNLVPENLESFDLAAELPIRDLDEHDTFPGAEIEVALELSDGAVYVRPGETVKMRARVEPNSWQTMGHILYLQGDEGGWRWNTVLSATVIGYAWELVEESDGHEYYEHYFDPSVAPRLRVRTGTEELPEPIHIRRVAKARRAETRGVSTRYGTRVQI